MAYDFLIQAGKEAEGLIEVEVVDVTAPFLVEELERQQRQQGAQGGDHLRAGIASLGHDLIEAKLDQQRQEQEGAGHARPAPAWRRQAQESLISDCGFVRAMPLIAERLARWSATAVEDEKGGMRP